MYLILCLTFFLISITGTFSFYAITSNARKLRSSKSLHLLSMYSMQFLSDRSQEKYIAEVISISSQCIKACIQDKTTSGTTKFIEVAFPENRKSDISVSESLDINRYYVRELMKVGFNNIGRSLQN